VRRFARLFYVAKRDEILRKTTLLFDKERRE